MELADIINAYVIPEIIAFCLVLGFIIKKWVKDVDNKWIPTIVAVVGIVLSVLMNLDSLSVGAIVGGAVSGLASTGLHQMFKQWIDNGGK
jgi:MFS superfamily sulfate permease-like transporter